jgi:hypothetical protein
MLMKNDKKEEGWNLDGKGRAMMEVDGGWWVVVVVVDAVAGTGGRRTYIVVVFSVCGFIVCVIQAYALQHAWREAHADWTNSNSLTNLIPVNLHSHSRSQGNSAMAVARRPSENARSNTVIAFHSHHTIILWNNNATASQYTTSPQEDIFIRSHPMKVLCPLMLFPECHVAVNVDRSINEPNLKIHSEFNSRPRTVPGGKAKFEHRFMPRYKPKLTSPSTAMTSVAITNNSTGHNHLHGGD